MFRTTDIVLIAVMISAAAFTYKTKHDAENRYSEIRRLETQIRVQENAVDVLRADWSLLTQPSRLQRLAERYDEDLGLVPAEAQQFGRIDEIPMRDFGIEDILGGSGESFAESDSGQSRAVR
ncbi:MAG: cell division protein FtsL [Rhizobiaceae bacterium]